MKRIRAGLAVAIVMIVASGCARNERRETTAAKQSVEVVAPATTPATTRAALRNSPGAIRGMPMRVVEVREGEIVVEPRFRFADGSASPRQTLRIDPARTQVFEHEIVSERTDERGRIIMETKPKAVELERIKTLPEGRAVQIGEQGGVAIDIMIMPLPPARMARPSTRTTRPSRTTRPASRP